jgi:hypothetical protein
MALFGGIAVVLSLSPSAWGWLLVNFAYFALLCLGEELTFRGYAFQRFARATGPSGAVFGFSLLYAFLESMTPGATRTTSVMAFTLAVGLSIAYLRTRALWVSWGLNFGWKASRALLFGLAVNGDNTHSPVVQGGPTGSFWLTGGGFGLESSWFAFFVMLALVPVIYRVTRELDFRYNTPEIVPGGIPVDIDAAARGGDGSGGASSRAAGPDCPAGCRRYPSGTGHGESCASRAEYRQRIPPVAITVSTIAAAGGSFVPAPESA